MEKDTMFKTRNLIRGKNSKGGDRVQMYLAREEVVTLAETLTDLLTGDLEKGVKVDLHISQRESEDGRKFESAIFFVKEVSNAPGGGPSAGGFKKKFVPKAAAKQLD